MFRKMKLATKMAIGFGVLVVISGVLGFMGWSGLTSVATNAELNRSGNECLNGLNQCAALRRDFAIRGFEEYAEGGDAAGRWQDAYDTLMERLKQLESAQGIGKADRAIVTDAIKQMPAYLTSFEHQKEARRTKDAAFASWGKVGWDVTEEIDKVMGDVIAPARKAATEAKDLDALARWTEIGTQLDETVVQEFLLLRVNAVYLLATNKEEQWANYEKQLAKVKSNIEAWANLVEGDSQLETVARRLSSYLSDYEQAGQQYHQGMQAGQSADSEMAAAAKAVLDTVERLQSSLKHEMATTTARTNTLMVVMAVSGIVLGIVLAVVITLSIIRPIKRIIESLTTGSEQVASASSQVSAASQSLAEGATEQAAGLEETSSSLEEMSSMTKQNADNAQQANMLSGEASRAAVGGNEAMERMNAAIAEIQRSSEETSKIIKVIDEIAFQTNLLALNAAVEAARAGEAGKGFAVVAEEVRNLAMRSAEAAKNTASMIEESVKNAGNGVEIAGEVGKQLQEIVTTVNKTSNLVGEIAAASQEQAQGIDQVNTAVAQMDKVTQQNAANAEESASASEELTAQAESMNEIVAELISLVGGAARRGESKASIQPVGRHELGQSDHILHSIAGGKNMKHKNALSAKPRREEAIPFGEDDELSQFNT